MQGIAEKWSAILVGFVLTVGVIVLAGVKVATFDMVFAEPKQNVADSLIEDFATLRSVITTAKKQGWNIIETLMMPAEQVIAALKYA